MKFTFKTLYLFHSFIPFYSETMFKKAAFTAAEKRSFDSANVVKQLTLSLMTEFKPLITVKGTEEKVLKMINSAIESCKEIMNAPPPKNEDEKPPQPKTPFYMFSMDLQVREQVKTNLKAKGVEKPNAAQKKAELKTMWTAVKGTDEETKFNKLHEQRTQTYSEWFKKHPEEQDPLKNRKPSKPSSSSSSSSSPAPKVAKVTGKDIFVEEQIKKGVSMVDANRMWSTIMSKDDKTKFEQRAREVNKKAIAEALKAANIDIKAGGKDGAEDSCDEAFNSCDEAEEPSEPSELAPEPVDTKKKRKPVQEEEDDEEDDFEMQIKPKSKSSDKKSSTPSKSYEIEINMDSEDEEDEEDSHKASKKTKTSATTSSMSVKDNQMKLLAETFKKYGARKPYFEEHADKFAKVADKDLIDRLDKEWRSLPASEKAKYVDKVTNQEVKRK